MISADGSYEVKLMTKAVVYYTGQISWQPPAIYKDFLPIMSLGNTKQGFYLKDMMEL